MALKETLNWQGNISNRLRVVQESQREIASGQAEKATYYLYSAETIAYAIECYIEGDLTKTKEAASLVVNAVVEYFYGGWRKQCTAPSGQSGQEEWNSYCLWHVEVMESLPWACALGDWAAVRKIAEYPPENRFPEAAKARGESAWSWALLTFLRGQPRTLVEHFLVKAETDKPKRLKLLCPVLRALLDSDAAQFEKSLLAYLTYYRKSEFKRELEKVVALDGTTLYHLGRRQGFEVTLPETVADHIIQLPK